MKTHAAAAPAAAPALAPSNATTQMCSAFRVPAAASAPTDVQALVAAMRSHPSSLRCAVLRLCFRTLTLAMLHRFVHAAAVLTSPVLAYALRSAAWRLAETRRAPRR